MREGSFDFGKKPPVDGYTKVTENTLYSDGKGYGISVLAEAVERKSGEKELNRDFLLFGGNTFTADIENGEYLVRVSIGDYDDEGSVTIHYTVNGIRYSDLIPCNEVIERIVPVTVTDGKIEFTFESGEHTCLNSIDIAAKKDIKITGVTSVVTVDGDKAAVKLTWDRADGVIGYRVFRKKTKINEKEKCVDVIMEEFIDEDVSLFEKHEYTVYGLYAHKFCTDECVKVNVDVVDGEKI